MESNQCVVSYFPEGENKDRERDSKEKDTRHITLTMLFQKNIIKYW